MRRTTLTTAGGIAALLLFASATAWAAGDSGTPSSTAAKPGQAQAESKAQKCAETKKKIADYEAAAAAAPKGAKVSGSETIKSDIAWYRSNCG